MRIARQVLDEQAQARQVAARAALETAVAQQWFAQAHEQGGVDV